MRANNIMLPGIALLGLSSVPFQQTPITNYSQLFPLPTALCRFPSSQHVPPYRRSRSNQSQVKSRILRIFFLQKTIPFSQFTHVSLSSIFFLL